METQKTGYPCAKLVVPSSGSTYQRESLLFAEDIVRGPLLADAFADQRLGGPVGRRYQIGIALVFDLQMLVEIFHQQSAGFAGDG